MSNKKMIAIFFAGFFFKDIIDDIFFLVRDQYPIEIFGFQITAAAHQIMLAVSTTLTTLFLYYGLKDKTRQKQEHG